MKKSLPLFLVSSFLILSTAFSSTECDGGTDLSSKTCSASHFLIRNRKNFRVAALEGILEDAPIQTHSYDISDKNFRKAEKEALSGGGEIRAWVSVALAYRYSVPKINLLRSCDDALRIMLQPATIDGDISAIFHIAAMVADDEVNAYFPQVRAVLNCAEILALSGSSPLLTVLLEIDQQTFSPVLERIQYKQALKRIVRSVPNARAYIALAQCTDEERFSTTVLGYYQKALELDSENVDAFLGAGIVIDNCSRNGVCFPEGTPTAIYYFSEAYARCKLLAGNYLWFSTL